MPVAWSGNRDTRVRSPTTNVVAIPLEASILANTFVNPEETMTVMVIMWMVDPDTAVTVTT